MEEHEDMMEPLDRETRHEEEQRAVREAGGGESEGFEDAERELIENASHESDSAPDPTHMAGRPEDAGADGDSVYGESDEESKEDL